MLVDGIDGGSGVVDEEVSVKRGVALAALPEVVDRVAGISGGGMAIAEVVGDDVTVMVCCGYIVEVVTPSHK